MHLLPYRVENKLYPEIKIILTQILCAAWYDWLNSKNKRGAEGTITGKDALDKGGSTVETAKEQGSIDG